MKFTVPVQQYDDTEELFIEIPEEIMQELGWKEGDTLNWNINQKEIILTKIENTTTIKKEHIQTNNNNITQDYSFNQKEILQ
jgi:antitoxin component of MazEF toxin-antitoxin module